MLICLCLLSPSSAAAKSGPQLGADVSYPQCGQPLPPVGAFAVVGVNKGLPFSPNPCLGMGDGASELLWAGIGAQLYANTADPGPALSSHWPNGQTAPEQCDTGAAPGLDTASCAYDYGWNAAADSYQDAVNAYIALGWAAADAKRTPVANGWWLDVETENSWEPNTSNNIAELQGEADFLKSVGAASVGFYSPPTSWQTITGATNVFAGYPSWVPGASSSSDAQARCSASRPTGGPTALVQFSSNGVATDLSCLPLPALVFAAGSPTVAAVDRASTPLVVMLPQAAAAPTLVAFTSNSTSGTFATAASGPWSTSVVVTVAAGAARTPPPVYYRDTNQGTAVIAASAAGEATATRTISIGKTSCMSAEIDHGFELALAQKRTRAGVARPLERARAVLHGSGHALIERDGCTDYELAVNGFRTRTAATRVLNRLRHSFNAATIEKT
jgi:hypothetical protein